MTQYINVVNLLRKNIREDYLTLYYHGAFEDSYVEQIISINDFDAEKKIRKRVAFLITESFQNIVRHKEPAYDKIVESSFGIRKSRNSTSIFSSNLIDEKTKEHLTQKLDKINELNPDELRKYYIDSLTNGELTKKGGAGLGLIEMAKKSKQPLQVEFSKSKEGLFSFNIQIDLLANKDTSAIDIQENIALNEIINNYKLKFLYKGEFCDEIIHPLLIMLSDNTGENNKTIFSVFHVAVELMQNVSRHAIQNEKEKKEGVFAILELSDGYYICTGNKVKKGSENFLKQIANLNMKNRGELDVFYRDELKANVHSEGDSAHVGLIDVRRITSSLIDVKLVEEETYDFIMIGAKMIDYGKN